MSRSKNKLAPAFLLPTFLLSIWIPPCFAEKADRDKPMHIEADQVLIDDARQISTFTGSVQLSQGTMLIRGDRVVVTQDKEGYKHGTAYGRTASFRQKRESLDEYVEGYGERIEYDTHAETVDFYVQARVKRDLDDVRGEHITYSQQTDIFQVHSGESATANSPPKRVHAILQPKSKEGAAQPSAAATPATDTLPIKPSTILSPTE